MVSDKEVIDLTLLDNERNSQSTTPTPNQQQIDCVGPDNTCAYSPIQGMETVTATISGYENLVRTRLIKLINVTGAVYTGSLTKSNTHVVCWKFKGAKYDLAKKLGINIVNHRWFEDCMKAGKRISEEPYKARGEVEEPLHWDGTGVQHCNSGGFWHEESCGSIVMEHSQGLSRPAVLGESSVPLTGSRKTGKRCRQDAFSYRTKFSEMDKGKRSTILDLASPTESLHVSNTDTSTVETRGLNQGRIEARSDHIQAISLNDSNNADEQESDEFWNEVIRSYDGSSEVEEPSCQLLPNVFCTARLNEHEKAGTRQAAASASDSSSRELYPKSDLQVTVERRDQSDMKAHPSAYVQREGLFKAMQLSSSTSEHDSNMYDDDDHMTGYPEFPRKRKHVCGESSARHGRLMRTELGASGELQNPDGVVGIVGGIEAAVQQTLVSQPVQVRLSLADECQQIGDSQVTPKESPCSAEGKVLVSPSPRNDITCVICHSETRPITEGMLTCGHKFCYPCIQRWADEVKFKSPSCPLCKVSFDFITVRECKAGVDGSCTQVVDEKVVQVCKHLGQTNHLTNLQPFRIENLCIMCGGTDAPELLLTCSICHERACHSFCLDPPSPGSSWSCSRCSHLQSRARTREAYERLFQRGSTPRGGRQQPDIVDICANVNEVRPNGLESRFGGSGWGLSSRTSPGRVRQKSLHAYLFKLNKGDRVH